LTTRPLEPCGCIFECSCEPERKALRREIERQLLEDRRLYGFSVLAADGQRVDPRTVNMEPLEPIRRKKK